MIGTAQIAEKLRSQGYRYCNSQAERMAVAHSVIITESSPGEDRNVRLQFITPDGAIESIQFNLKLAGETIRAYDEMMRRGDETASAHAHTRLAELKNQHPVAWKKENILVQ